MASVQVNTPDLANGQANAHLTVNEAVGILDAHVHLAVKDRDLATPPGSPTTGDRYLIATSPTGAWAGQANAITVYLNGAWKFATPKEGWTCWVDDEDLWLRHDGSAWTAIVDFASSASLTASTTQTQGQQALVRTVNWVGTCANANDVVTLPAAAAGLWCVVINRGAQTLQVFPASGDKVEGGATNASTTIATAKIKAFFAVDGTDWFSILGA